MPKQQRRIHRVYRRLLIALHEAQEACMELRRCGEQQPIHPGLDMVPGVAYLVNYALADVEGMSPVEVDPEKCRRMLQAS